jgi:hypothetical protein
MGDHFAALTDNLSVEGCLLASRKMILTILRVGEESWILGAV